MSRLVLVLSVVCAMSLAAQVNPVALLLTGGKVFTGDVAKPWADAVAMSGERIVAVGTSAELRPLAGPATRIIDVGGRVVVPGFNDAHNHVPDIGDEPVEAEVPEGTTREGLLAALRRVLETDHSTKTVTAAFPLGLLDAGLSRDDLDALSATRPIHLQVLGGHSQLLNTAALRAWGIAENVTDPAGGRYGRRGGRLDGWVYEHAVLNAMLREAEASTDEQIRTAVGRFEDEALPLGVTSVQTMPIFRASRLQAVLASMQPKLRWRVMDMRTAPYDGSPGTMPVKYIADGIPIERGAAMRDPYADAPSQRGTLNFTEAEIGAMVRDAAEGKRQLLVHAVGDRTVETVIAAMERTSADWPRLRVRLEHADGLTPDLAARARKLGIVVVQNPTHFMLRELMTTRYGPERLKTWMPVRSLVEAGNHVALGADGPLNPFLNLFCAAIHPTNPGEALSVEQGVRAYTSGSAFAEFQEMQKGTIAQGMLADLAVLSQDIFTIPPSELPKTTSMLTIVAGQVVFESSEHRNQK